ncbi:MAG TPA: hypothetical protein VMZ30_13850 [Pyrinomonadaceae bacterium]|nr:hypothetical protein [Pyrinomonadaceae bacterium]
MPASVDARLRRGASHTQNFTLSNTTGTRLRFRCSVEDVWYDERNTRVTGRPGTLPRSASEWVQFSQPEVVIEPYSSVVVKAIVTVPQTAAGGYYTSPVFEAMPADPLKSAPASQDDIATTTIRVRFRGLMMFTTLDATEYNVEIMGGHVSPPTASSELEMQLDVRNRSTTHARVRGAFAILNSSGSLVGRGTIEEKRYLPGQRSNLRAGWSGGLPAGKYTSVITLSYDRVGIEPTTLSYELPLVVQ